jgi:3-oxoacyl-[acyl-carrier-protein] synthase II
VTGVGLVTSLGLDAPTTMRRVLAGDRGFADVTVFPIAPYTVRVAAEVVGLERAAAGLVPDGDAPWSRSDMLAALAAAEALAGARGQGLAGSEGLEAGGELWMAASTGGMLETEGLLSKLFTGGLEQADPALLRCHPISSPADRLARSCGPFARATTVCSACSSGALAIGLGASRVRRGQARWVLAGGIDALSRLTYTGFGALASLDPLPCRPFDRDRKGLTLGEGAAFLVLEAEDAAVARGATILGEVAGYAVACEANHITQPEASGRTAGRVMAAALADAGVTPEQVGYVNAHGTGTPLNDPMEAAALGRLLGARAREVLISSQKGQIGHTLSAAGAVEAAITLLSMAQGVVPPSGGLTNPDPAIELRLVGRVAERAEVDVALSNSFGFGGTDASLVLARRGVGAPPARRDQKLVITGAAALGPLGELSGEACEAYADPGGALGALGAAQIAAGAEDPRARLDPAAGRRLDRAARQMARLTLMALGNAGEGGGEEVGIVAGSAFGTGDEASAFLARIEAKGPRFAPPLDFPNLVPSSPGAHAAIVAGLRGPALTVSDLGTTALASLAVAVDLLQDGRAGALVAAAAEPPSQVVERALAAACSSVGEGPRGHGGGAVVVEAASRAAARGARPLARLVGAWAWSSWPASSGASLASPASPWRAGQAGWTPAIPPPSAPRGEVVVADGSTQHDALLAALGWSGVPVLSVGPRTGWHEGALAVALAAAVGRVASGQVDEVLVIGLSLGRGGAALLARP